MSKPSALAVAWALAPSMNSASLVPSLAISFPIAGANLGSCDAYFLAGPISLIAPLLNQRRCALIPANPSAASPILRVRGPGQLRDFDIANCLIKADRTHNDGK